MWRPWGAPSPAGPQGRGESGRQGQAGPSGGSGGIPLPRPIPQQEWDRSRDGPRGMPEEAGVRGRPGEAPPTVVPGQGDSRGQPRQDGTGRNSLHSPTRIRKRLPETWIWTEQLIE